MHGTPHQVTYYAEQSLYPLIVSVPVSTSFLVSVFVCTICTVIYMYCHMVPVPVSAVYYYCVCSSKYSVLSYTLTIVYLLGYWFFYCARKAYLCIDRFL